MRLMCEAFGESTEDVTLQYTDLDTHIKALREELDALFSMMEQATSMEDILAIQSQITEVRYEIENYESQLRVYDNQVIYSTVYPGFVRGKPESSAAGTTFGERVKIKFNDNLYQMRQGFRILWLDYWRVCQYCSRSLSFVWWLS